MRTESRQPMSRVCSRRRASVSLWFLLAAGVLLAAFAMAINLASLQNASVDLQVAADAASDAAVHALADDDTLTGDLDRYRAVIERSRQVAIQYAARNPTLGRPTLLDANLTNAISGDIVFANLDVPTDPSLDPIANPTAAPLNQLLRINAVRIQARRLRSRGNPVPLPLGGFSGNSLADMQSSSTAMLDRDVIGFRPAEVNIPVMPIGLLSDRTAANPLAWEYAVEAGNGPDAWRFNRTTQQFEGAPPGDLIREFTMVIQPNPGGDPADSNGYLLSIGATTLDEMALQVQNGISAADLAGLGGQLVFGPTNTLTVAGSALIPTSGNTALLNQLQLVRQTGRLTVFPLVGSHNSGTGSTLIQGFVAARIVSITPPAGSNPLTMVLQAGVEATATAVTDASRRGINGNPITNRYVAKARFVE